CAINEGPMRDLNFPLTANAAFNGIRDVVVNGIPDPVDASVTGGVDAFPISAPNGIDDRFDPFAPGNSYKGDHDDIWAGTVRSQDSPFRGRNIPSNATITVGGNTLNSINPAVAFTTIVIESPIAEVVWWTALQDDSDFVDDFVSDSIQVYRRVLLIRPDLSLPAFTTVNGALSYLATNDISARIVTVPITATTFYFQVVANSMKDLAVRQNRFCHVPITVGPPRNLLSRGLLWNLRSADYTGTGFGLSYNGNDILLSEVTSFDIKVYSPNALVGLTSGVTVEPHDIGFENVAIGNKSALGAYVDLGHSLGYVGGGWFSGFSTPQSQLTYQFRFERYTGTPPPIYNGLVETVYDTWTPFYESDGVNQDGDALTDEGTNGVDDGGLTAAPDDDSERETRPPYPFPVRGIKVSIGLIEKLTKQVHQSSVIHSYVPE
ncbi:MAG: hypothetical protein ACI87E_001873, partial [Mariniblastus sp.]